MVAQGFERVESKADVAWVGENTSRFREWEGVSERGQLLGQIGASLGLCGVRFAGGNCDARGSARRRRRVAAHHQREGDAVVDPVERARPSRKIVDHVLRRRAVHGFRADHGHQGSREDPAPGEGRVGVGQPDSEVSGGGGCARRDPERPGRRPRGRRLYRAGQAPGAGHEARQYRVVEEVVNERSRMMWYETRSNAPSSAPWNARTIKAYFLPPPPPKDRV